MSQKVTIAEVAQEAGVSIATVSRVLNQREGKIKISNETKLQVQSVADRLGYQADPFASALRTRRSGLFGAIIRDLRDPFLIEVFIELQSAAREKGIELLLGNADFNVSVAGRQANIMNTPWFDGLILLGDMPGDMSIITPLKKSHKLCVAVACGTHRDLPSVNLDEIAGIRLALDYLTSLGHRRIACMADPNLLGVSERLTAFQEDIGNFDLIVDEGYIQVCANTRKSVGEGTIRLMGLPVPPTAILCCTDQMALGAINQLNRSGYVVPQDLSVIGFDDIAESANTFPSLTTIRQKADVIAHEALNLLIKNLERQADCCEVESILISPQLVERESCAHSRNTVQQGLLDGSLTLY